MTSISFTEIARRLGIHRTTARIRVAAGDIPGGHSLYTRMGSGRLRWMCDREVFEKWLESNKLAIAKFDKKQRKLLMDV